MAIIDYLYWKNYVTNLNEFRNNNLKTFNYARLVKLDKEIVKYSNLLKQAEQPRLHNN